MTYQFLMQQEEESQVLAGKMARFEPLGLIKMTWHPRFLEENEQPLAMIQNK